MPGSASRVGSVCFDWCAPRKRSTLRAKRGSSQSSSYAVSSASRPKGVEYQGTPAYGKGPSAVAAVSMARSANERRSQAFAAGFDVTMRVASGSAAGQPAEKPCRCRARRSRSSHSMRSATVTGVFGFSAKSSAAAPCVKRTGADGSWMRVRRWTASSPS